MSTSFVTASALGGFVCGMYVLLRFPIKYRRKPI